MDYEKIRDKIESIIRMIASENAEFICETCIRTKDEILDLASEILGEDEADILEKFYYEVLKEEN